VGKTADTGRMVSFRGLTDDQDSLHASLYLVAGDPTVKGTKIYSEWQKRFEIFIHLGDTAPNHGPV